MRGWFRTSRNPLTGAPDLRAIGLTALEVAAAMEHLHAQGVLHGVSDTWGDKGGGGRSWLFVPFWIPFSIMSAGTLEHSQWVCRSDTFRHRLAWIL